MATAVATRKPPVAQHRRPVSKKSHAKVRAPRINCRAQLEPASFSGFG